jgi:hypothetical protein
MKTSLICLAIAFVLRVAFDWASAQNIAASETVGKIELWHPDFGV